MSKLAYKKNRVQKSASFFPSGDDQITIEYFLKIRGDARITKEATYESPDERGLISPAFNILNKTTGPGTYYYLFVTC